MPGTNPFRALHCTLWRALPAHAADQLLSAAPSPEGRFHHSGQSALYLSPSARSAARATARQHKGPQILLPLLLSSENIADLRNPATLRTLGLQGHEPQIPWRPERIAGRPATSWHASDAARAAGADGLIWTSRNAPHLWHLVLFSWNTPPGTTRLTPPS